MVRSFPLAAPGAMAGARCRYLYVSPARPAFYAGPHFYESGDAMSTAADLRTRLDIRPPIAVNTLRNGYQC